MSEYNTLIEAIDKKSEAVDRIRKKNRLLLSNMKAHYMNIKYESKSIPPPINKLQKEAPSSIKAEVKKLHDTQQAFDEAVYALYVKLTNISKDLIK